MAHLEMEADEASGAGKGEQGAPMVVDEQDPMQRDLPLTGTLSAVVCLLIFFVPVPLMTLCKTVRYIRDCIMIEVLVFR